MLKKNRSLKILYLGTLEVNLGYNKTYDKGSKYISDALKTNNTLKSLYFGILSY